jgi:hypothetical protein
MKTLEIGQSFKNIWGEIHTIVRISKTGKYLTCKDSSEIEVKFCFYEASGTYIKVGRTTRDLGICAE